ncbi:MAG: hypothetical protein QXM08_00450 [Thermofilaceae archaeon]
MNRRYLGVGLLTLMILPAVLATTMLGLLYLVPPAEAGFPVVAALLIGMVIGGIVGYFWARTAEDIGTPGETIDLVAAQIDLLYYYIQDTVENVLTTTAALLPRTANYYIRMAEAHASAEEGCRQGSGSFYTSKFREVLEDELSTIFRDVVGKVVSTYMHGFAYHKALALRLYTLNGGPYVDSYLGAGVLSPGEVYIGPRGSPWEALPQTLRVGSPCRIEVIFYFDDGSQETVTLAEFPLGEIVDIGPVSADVVFNIAQGKVGNRTITHWDLNGYCHGPSLGHYYYGGQQSNGTWFPFGSTVYPGTPLGRLRQLTASLSSIYREGQNSFDMYCLMMPWRGDVLIPPPSVILPYSIEDLQKLPPELRMIIYMAYLESLMNVNWTRTPVLNASNVQAVYPGMILADGVWYTPLIVPVNIPVIVGYPVPLMGTWFVNGRIVTYEILPVPEDHTYERIGNTTLYWIRDPWGNIVGVGVDINDDGIPDVYSRYYIVPEFLQIWDPIAQTWKEVNEFTFGPKPLEEIVKETNLEELIRRLRGEGQNSFIEELKKIVEKLKSIFDLKTTTGWAAVAGLLLVILLLAMVAAGGRTRVVVVGGRALSPSKYLGVR